MPNHYLAWEILGRDIFGPNHPLHTRARTHARPTHTNHKYMWLQRGRYIDKGHIQSYSFGMQVCGLNWHATGKKIRNTVSSEKSAVTMGSPPLLFGRSVFPRWDQPHPPLAIFLMFRLFSIGLLCAHCVGRKMEAEVRIVLYWSKKHWSIGHEP